MNYDIITNVKPLYSSISTIDGALLKARFGTNGATGPTGASGPAGPTGTTW